MMILLNLLTAVTQGTIGALFTIGIIAITAFAVTKNPEKITIVLLPIGIAYWYIGLSRANTEINMAVATIFLIAYSLTILYDNRNFLSNIVKRIKAPI